MMPEDPLLAAWAATRARRAGEPALFDTQGKVLFRFGEMEELSRGIEADALRDLRAGGILGVQIGNHAHWPALLLACLRRGIVVLPLERTMSDLERAAALQTCRATALLATMEEGVEPLAGATPVDWSGQPPA
ncbi:MAG: hypothetical protein H0W66_09790, partial [Chthoniobacterales bacterium]|nr:hypothetical protein [Chthoniobacterales bacterium]